MPGDHRRSELGENPCLDGQTDKFTFEYSENVPQSRDVRIVLFSVELKKKNGANRGARLKGHVSHDGYDIGLIHKVDGDLNKMVDILEP